MHTRHTESGSFIPLPPCRLNNPSPEPNYPWCAAVMSLRTRSDILAVWLKRAWCDRGSPRWLKGFKCLSLCLLGRWRRSFVSLEDKLCVQIHVVEEMSAKRFRKQPSRFLLERGAYRLDQASRIRRRCSTPIVCIVNRCIAIHEGFLA